MTEAADLLADTSIPSEIAGVDLGDSRRDDRYGAILEALGRQPDASIPEAMSTEAALEAYYRFIRNDAIGKESMLAPHFDETRQRAEDLERVLVVHDTGEMNFEVHDEPCREHLAEPTEARQSFQWHVSLALSADHHRAPLGLVASRPFVHESELPDREARQFWDERNGILDNEKWRWMEAVEEVEGRLEDVGRPIHVIDRECDDFELLFQMSASDYPFAIRMTYDRNVSDGPRRCDYGKLDDALDEVDWVDDQRDVLLSARPKRKASDGHPVRRARNTRLKTRATTVELRRPDHIKANHAPRRVEVHVVEVREVDPPDDAEPVRWVLATTEPIDTADHVWEVVDFYRARWTIEEYFKAVKTGTGYTDLQHRTAQTLLKALAAKAIIAWNLLRLRHLGRHLPDADASKVVNSVQLSILKRLRPKIVSDGATARDAMDAIADLGGHISNNGPPGWLVLGRGWDHLLELEQGFRLAQDQATEM